MKIQVRDVVFVALILAFGIFLYLNIETYEEEILTGEGAQVHDQQFLALQKHLANFDTQVIVSDDHKQLFSDASFNPLKPSVTDTIILTESEVVISHDLSEEILSWIANGGHIIIGLETDNYASTFSTNALLKELGVQTKKFDRTLLAQNDDKFMTDNVPTLVDTEAFGEIEVNVEDSLYIHFAKSEEVLFSSGVLRDSTHHQPTIVQLGLGDGLITLMSDVQIWNNYQINDNDNILFIHQLIDYGHKVYVFERHEPVMWHQLIPKYSPSLYWILLMTVVLFAWFFAIRFGSIKVVNDTVVTYFSQHIRAAGQFYWMNGQQDKLLTATRNLLIDDISARISKSKPSEEQIIEVLGKLSHWPNEKIYLYVFKNNKVNETQFTQIMQGLQQLRKMI